MQNKRVVLLGFEKMAEYAMYPVARDLAAVRELEAFHSIREFVEDECPMAIDILFVSAKYLGFEIAKRMTAIREVCPMTEIVCISLDTLSLFICRKLMKNGIDVLFLNMETQADYDRASYAIKNRGRYYPEALKTAIENRDFICDGGLHTLSRKERDSLVLTMQGYTLKAIAREMQITKTTASTMRRNSYRKIGVNNLADLIKFGLNYNLHVLEGNENAV